MEFNNVELEFNGVHFSTDFLKHLIEMAREGAVLKFELLGDVIQVTRVNENKSN